MTIKYQQEFLSTVVEDIKPLLKEHWEEIALNKEKIKLNPDWDTYEELEHQGRLKVFTARQDRSLVGYFVVIVSRHIHHKDHLFASNDIIYLSPKHRKGFTSVKLIKFAEKHLKKDGVSVMVISSKDHKPFHSLMEFLKFKPVERLYSKYIGD